MLSIGVETTFLMKGLGSQDRGQARNSAISVGYGP